MRTTCASRPRSTARLPIAFALCGLAAVFAARPAVAQASPETPQPTDTPQIEGRTAAVRPSAEQWFRPGTWLLSAHVGGAAFTDFQRAQARPVPGADVDRTGYAGDFERRISATTSVAFVAGATYWGGTSWGVRLAGAYVPTRFSVHTREQALRVLAADPESGEPRYASLGISMADVAIVFRFPHSLGRIVPYGVAGVGVVHYRVRGDEDLPAEARAGFADGGRTSPAAVFGLGAVLPLQRNNLLLSFELTNHLARTPLDDAGRGEPFDVGGVPMQLADDGPSADTDGIGMASNLRLSVGLTMPVRRPR
jgi:hypothetical protein